MDIKTCISKLRNKIYIDKSKLTDPELGIKRNYNIFVQDDLLIPSTGKKNIGDICKDANDQTSQKLCKKKEEKLTGTIYPAATRTKDLPLKEINKNLNYPFIDLREQEKEKLRKLLIYGREFGFGENSTEPQEINKNLNHPLIDLREQEKEKLRKVLIYGGEFGFGENSTESQSGKRMVRYGEYSPRNPNIVPSDRPLLALGEYEERRRQLMEQKKREYLEQMNQARFNFKPSRKEVYTDDEISDFPSLMNHPALTHSLQNENPSHESNTAGTQTEDAGDEFNQEVASPLHENGSVKSQFNDDMPGINAQFSPGSYHALGNNSIPVSPLTLTVPDDPFQSPKIQSLSPRERKLADLRGSENYSPSFFGIPNHRGGPIDSGTLHYYQPDDQQLKTRMRHQAYQEELRQQIEEKKRLEALQREKERKEDEAIMRRVREQQEKMRMEYEQEKAQRQIRQAQRLHMAEEFQRRQEELQWEAQQLREEEMKRRRGVGGDGQVQEPVQKEFNEHIILKQNMDDHQTNESEENQSISFSCLSHSHPVPALRTKLLSEVNSVYQSPKEITQILDNNFPKAVNYPHTNHTSIKSAHYLSQQLPKANATKEHHKRHTKRHKHRSAYLDLPIDSNAPNQQKSTIGPALQKQNLPDELPTSVSHTKSHPEPASREQHHNQKMPLSPHVEVLNHNGHDEEIPLIPRNHNRSGDIISEARPSNILTQLGDFRRQMQINHRKMQEDLQKKFPEKSSSF